MKPTSTFPVMLLSLPSLLAGPYGIRTCWYKMKMQRYTIFLCIIVLLIVYRMGNLHHQQTEIKEVDPEPFEAVTDSYSTAIKVGYLPRGIVQPKSDMELKPLWVTKNSELKECESNHQNLIAIPVGIKQKMSVDAIVKKTILLLSCSTMMGMSMAGMISGGVKL